MEESTDERQELFEFLRESLRSQSVSLTKKLTADMTIMVVRAANFNAAKDKTIWRNPANQSEVRPGLVCARCEEPVVMSNWSYDQYVQMKKKPRVCCEVCLPKLVDELDE